MSGDRRRILAEKLAAMTVERGCTPAQTELPLLGSAPAEAAMTASNEKSGARAYVHGIRPDAKNRACDDFYLTPPEGTSALLSAIRLRAPFGSPPEATARSAASSMRPDTR